MAPSSTKKRLRQSHSARKEPGTRREFLRRWDLIALASTGVLLVCLLNVWLTPIESVSTPESQLGDSQLAARRESPEQPAGPRSIAQPPSAIPRELDTERVEEEIRRSLDQLVKTYPQDHLAVHLAGIIYTRLKQTAKAESLLRQSLAIAPDDVQVRQDLAELLTQTGREAEAMQILAGDLDRGGASPDFIHLLAETQIRLGQLTQARDTLLAGLKSFPESAKNWLSLGELQLQLGDLVQAESSIRRALAHDQASEPALLALGQSLALQRKRAEATEARRSLKELRQANDRQRKSFEEAYQQSFRGFACSTFRSLANIYRRHQEPATAAKWLDRALALDPEDVQSLAALASQFRVAGDFARAADVSERIVQLQPETLSNYTNLANLRMELGDVHQAEETLQLAARRNLGQGRAQLQLAQFYLLLKREREAIPIARRAVEELGTADAYLALISALEAAGQSALAREELAKAKRLAPADPRLQGPGRN